MSYRAATVLGRPSGSRVEEIRRTRILRALAEELGERDLRSVKVAHVITRAGVSRTAFYELFGDVEECFAAAFEWGLARAGAAMGEAYAAEARWLDGVRAAVGALLGLLDAEPAFARLCVVHVLGAGTELLRRRAAAIAVVCEYVDRGRLQAGARSEPPEVTAEGVVGAVLGVIHNRLLAAPDPEQPLTALAGPLVSLIVLPYMGAAAASRELTRPAPRSVSARGAREPATTKAVEQLGMRLTYRTARVLVVIGAHPGASNREIAGYAGIVDQGQISRLLSRLEGLGLIANVSTGGARGAPNAWTLTSKGVLVERSVQLQQERACEAPQ